MDRDAVGRRLLAVLVLAVLAVAGCSGGGLPVVPAPAVGTPASSAPVSPSAGNPSPGNTVLREPAGTVVLDQAAPGALSVAVSRTLFDAAPVAVVAADRGADLDGAALDSAARSAEKAGVPLLLADPAAPRPVAGEVARLGAHSVLALGPIAAPLRLVAGLSVFTDPGDVPAVGRARGLGTVVVLVRADGDAATLAGARAAAATARAAGAHVVGVRGTDPRADRAAIAALRRYHPHRVVAAGAGFGSPATVQARAATASLGAQLPGGGQVFFPGRRLVALYGHPGTPALGVLGEQGLAASIARARAVAAPYARLSAVPVVPAFEIIATVASGAAGPDRNYSAESTVAQLRPWVETATRAGLYVVLDLQPGRTSFLTQARMYAPLLALPNVGLALDPEWRLGPNQVHLKQIGSVASREINAVSDFLAKLTAARHLPQKLLVLHQFRTSMIRDEAALNLSHDEVSILIHMDGQGAQGAKNGTWAAVKRAAPAGVSFGWKNFYDEDKPILTPAQTMAKRPAPVMISYQ